MNFFDEMIAAGRGVLALFMGDQNAAVNFDFSLRGLAGSIIALIIALTLSAYLPVILGSLPAHVRPHDNLIFTSSVYLVQIVAAALVLHRFARLDAFVPYLVADSWVTFFVTVLALIPVFLQLERSMVLMVLAVVIIVVKVNIVRIIVSLSVWKIVAFLAVHLMSGVLAQLLLGSLLGMGPLAS